MKNAIVSITAVMLLSLAVSASFADLPSYTGSLAGNSTSDPIDVTGSWGPVDVSWTVTETTPGIWNYDYSASAGRTFTHFLLETSSTFTAANMWNATGGFSGATIDTFTSTNYGASDSGLIGPMYGVRFNNMTQSSVNLSFTSNRAPVWGDFYTADGQGHYAWNSGFTNPNSDPGDAVLPSNGAYSDANGYYLLVPDTTNSPGGSSTPEPGSIGLGLCALGLAVGTLRRRKRSPQA